jgi:hypothetical protein
MWLAAGGSSPRDHRITALRAGPVMTKAVARMERSVIRERRSRIALTLHTGYDYQHSY